MKKTSSFQIEPELARLKGTYPRPDDMRTAIGTGERERGTVARLWLSEGIPYAFRECPALYEEVRNWLATCLEVHPKEIGMVGSGRIGYSMKQKDWGKRYDPSRSDLDLLVVSASLFDRLRQDFQRWRRDYDCRLVKPCGKRQAEHWASNRKGGQRNIDAGFINSWRVPNQPPYEHFLSTSRRLDELERRLLGVCRVSGEHQQPSLRCYKDWAAFERQVARNLKLG